MNRRRALRDGAEDWRDALAPGEARFVPAIVQPQMPDIVRRALAAGARPPLEYMGAGMTGVVFCAGDIAYKVARDTRPIDHQFFEEEAEWLRAVTAVPEVAPHVVHFRGFDPDNLVIVRDCPVADPDQSAWRYGENKLHDLHRQIERDMIPHGWTAPEFKLDSYVLTTRGPVLVDASMPSRVGEELARYVEAVAADERPLWTTPEDLAFAVRMEAGRTLTQAKSDRLEALIAERWPKGSEVGGDVWYHGSPDRFEQFHTRVGNTFGTGTSDVPLFLTRDPKFAALYAGANGYIYTVRPHVVRTFDARGFVLDERYWPPPRDALTPEGQVLYDDLVENRIFPELIRYGTRNEVEDEWLSMHDSQGTYASIFARDYDVMETTEMKRWLRAHDYDSFFVSGDGPDDNLAIFNPEQIKILSVRPSRPESSPSEIRESGRLHDAPPSLEALVATADARYPLAGAEVDGRRVRVHVPNTESIDGYFRDQETLGGVRAVPMADFGGPRTVFYAADDFARSERLARAIEHSGEINPLIVGFDDEGAFIIEGAHRYVALYELRARAFPALVVVGLD
jgi:hypothetical protein